MDDSPDDTDIISLDVRGQSFFVSLSTLLSANDGCSYFSARFRPDSMFDAGLIRVDEQGRNVYELDRDPSLFRHVMHFLETNSLPEEIGSWARNKSLWNGLREEAGFFGLDGLMRLLQITFSCSPEDEDGLKNKGILYWLGTKKGTMSYLNPFERGAVGLESCYECYDDEYYEGPDETTEKGYFFQYRPNEEGKSLTKIARKGGTDIERGLGGSSGNNKDVTYDDLMNSDGEDAKKNRRYVFGGGLGSFIFSGCDACRTGIAGEDPTVISFKNGLAISPTHYSIRNAGCYGMSGDWDFSGSVDGGKTWMTLHRQRGRTPLYGGLSGGSDADRHEGYTKLRDYVRSFEGTEAREEAVCDYMEQHQRHTFKLHCPSADFFTHFRLISVQMYTYDERKEFCLHGIGFEIWGDVRDELLGGQPSDSIFARIDELESQTSELRVQNKKLESRVKQLESKLKSQGD